MKITNHQLRRIIREAAGDHAFAFTDPMAQKFENILNSWLPGKVTVEHVKGRTYQIKGVEAAMIPEVKEEIREFPGASFEYELGSGVYRDIGVSFG